MVFLLLLVLFVPVVAVWTSVSLGTKIRKNTPFQRLGCILIWEPVLSFVWNTVFAIALFYIPELPEPVKELIFYGKWLGYFIFFEVFLGPVVTLGVAAIAIHKRLYVIHSLVTILFCILVIWWFFSLLS